MTVPVTTNRLTYLGTGAVASYPYTFKIFNQNDLIVTKVLNGVETVQTLTTHYTVTGVGEQGGGNVVLTSNLANGTYLVIRRVAPLLQNVDLRNQGTFFPEVHEDEFDLLTMLLQQHQDILDRCLKIADGHIASFNSKLSSAAGVYTPGAVLAINPSGNGIVMGPTFSDLSGAAGAAAAAAASAAAALVSENNAAASAASAATSATSAAASATAADASATAAAASAAQLKGTSTTSLAIAVASKVFTTQSGKFFDVGNWLLITSDANPANYMHGQVTAYSGTSLTVNVTNIGGSGTFADWTIRVSGTRGAVGGLGPGYTATSDTSFAIGVGSKAFTTQAGLAYTVGARVRASSAADGNNYMEGLVTAYSGTTLTVNVTLTGGSGTLTDWNINLAGDRGVTGASGINGVSAGLSFRFNTATSGDPGSGKVLGNNATPASITQINVSEIDVDAGDVSASLTRWGQSTTASDKGVVRIVDRITKSNYMEFKVTAAPTDAGAYRTVPVSFLSSNGTIANNADVSIEFERSGDKGLDGAGAGDVVGPASSVNNRYAVFSGTTGKLIADSGQTSASFDAAGSASAVQTNLNAHTADNANPHVTTKAQVGLGNVLDTAQLPAAGGSMSGAINEKKGADIASAATTDIAGATGNIVDVTGTVTITAFGTIQAGSVRIVRFMGALTLTHNATSLILPTGANIVTAAGDIAIFVSLGSGNWYCANYVRASGAVIGPNVVETLTNKRITARVSTEASNATPAIAADTNDIHTITALAAAATFGAPTGTPTQGQKIIYRIKDNGTARALSWNAIYRAMGTALPSTTVVNKTLYLGFIYNSTDSKWDLVASAQEA